MFNRFFKRQAVKRKYTLFGGDYKTLPEKLTDDQISVIKIFKEMLYNHHSELSYHNKTETACISLTDTDGNTEYMFISEDKVRINDSVKNVDINISDRVKNHLMWLFFNKQDIDFIKKMKESNTNVNNSMNLLYEKIKKSK